MSKQGQMQKNMKPTYKDLEAENAQLRLKLKQAEGWLIAGRGALQGSNQALIDENVRLHEQVKTLKQFVPNDVLDPNMRDRDNISVSFSLVIHDPHNPNPYGVIRDSMPYPAPSIEDVIKDILPSLNMIFSGFPDLKTLGDKGIEGITKPILAQTYQELYFTRLYGTHEEYEVQRKAVFERHYPQISEVMEKEYGYTIPSHRHDTAWRRFKKAIEDMFKTGEGMRSRLRVQVDETLMNDEEQNLFPPQGRELDTLE